MARNFSEDGALGAMTGDAPAAGSQTGGVSTSLTPSIMNNFNMTGTPADQSSTLPITTDLGDAGSGGGWGGGLQGAPGGIRATRSPESYSSDNYNFGSGAGGFLPPASAGFDFTQHTGGMQTGAVSFSHGGAIDDGEGQGDPNATDPQGSMMGNRLQQQINQALATVNSTLAYTRQKYGIGGQQQAMNTEGFNQSDNIDDRRDTPGDPADAGNGTLTPASYKRNPTEQLIDRARSAYAGATNKLSQAAGINDIGGDGSTATPGAQQAIPTDEEEAQ